MSKVKLHRVRFFMTYYCLAITLRAHRIKW
nr:MAG TPA: hypothetical protein [Caudoviricetes sp.]